MGGGCVVEVIGASGFGAAFPPAAPGAAPGAMDCSPWEPGMLCGVWAIDWFCCPCSCVTGTLVGSAT